VHGGVTAEVIAGTAGRGQQAAQIVQELGLSDQAHSFVGNLGPVGDPQRLIAAAWNVEDWQRFPTSTGVQAAVSRPTAR
jgi:hypothetical protein